MRLTFFLFLSGVLLAGCGSDEPGNSNFKLLTVFSGAKEISLEEITTGISPDQGIALNFSSPVDKVTAQQAISLMKVADPVPTSMTFSNNNKTVILFPNEVLESNIVYIINLTDELTGKGGKNFIPLQISFKTSPINLTVVSFLINGEEVKTLSKVENVPLSFNATITFSTAVNPNSLKTAVSLAGQVSVPLQVTLTNSDKTASISSTVPMRYLSRYTFTISAALKGAEDEGFSAISKTLYSEIDFTPKMPLLPNDEDNDNDNTNDLLSVVQKQTFKYFYDFAQPASGMSRERNTSGDLITSGGSGFGIMALIVGMERNFITQSQGLDRMDKILDYLESADRFHGAYSHWINGNTGDVIPFSTNDNGGDLVETAYLIEGLITFRQYITNNSISNSYDIVNRINAIWEAVEWDWYRQDNQNVLYWHWSTDKGWIMNHQIKGWNECLITYVLAASAPANNTIPKVVYDAGWASNGGMKNGSSYEGVTLPLGSAWGGPLFFAHYSFLGLDPRNLSDVYANYWTQNVNHSMINYKYCVRNPKAFAGYSENCWGLTASDNQSGYNAHSPTNDLGVITPTAALSSFPYTPEESMRALKFFYYTMGDRLWGTYGFYDAFNPSENWYADSYLAIDQGPIVVMIENYRTGLLWELFMSAPEVQGGLTKLGFDY